MTRITFAAPIYDRYRKMGGDVIYKRGDHWVIRYKGTKCWRKYTLIMRCHQLFSVFAEYFKDVKGITRDHWTEYKEHIGYSRSGLNPYLKNNIT